MTTKLKKADEIHTAEAQADGVPILAPGIYGMLGAGLLARPEKLSWLEAQGYVSIDADQGVCSFTEAGATWLDDQTDESMDVYFYSPPTDFNDVVAGLGDLDGTV